MSQVTGRGRAKSKNDRLSKFCDLAIRLCLYGVVFLIPLFFLPNTSEALEFNKQNLVVIFSLAAVVAWLGKSIALGSFQFKKNILNLPILVFLIIYGLSSYFSLDRYFSFVGAAANEGASFVTFFCFALIYFVIINNFDTIEKIKSLLNVGLASAFLVGLFSFLQMIGAYIFPFDFTKSKAFNSLGTYSSLAIFCALILTVAISYLISLYATKEPKKESAGQIVLTVFLWLLGALMLLNIVMIDFFTVWICIILAMLIILAFCFSRAHEINTKWLMLPMIILVVSVLFMFINLPLNLGLPMEVSPSVKASWEISKSSLQENPLFGSGPATYVFDYAKYHPIEVNNTVFWNLRFDRAQNQFFTLLPTVGLLGTVSFLLILGALIFLAVSRFFKAHSDANWLLGIGIFAGWMILSFSKFLYASNFTLEMFYWVFMALVVIFALTEIEERKILFESSPKMGLLVSFVFIIVVTASVAGLYLIGQRYVAEVNYVNGVKAATSLDNFDEINGYLSKSVRLNKYRESYYRSLAQLYFMAIEREAQKVTQGISDEEKQAIIKNIQVLTNGAVNSAKQATLISPNNIVNWAFLGDAYNQVSSYVGGASQWAIESYTKAIELEPNNPVNYTGLAKTYLYNYDAALAASEVEGADKKKLEQEAQDNLDKALVNLNKAIELKNNYSPAHYQMSLYHVRKNDLKKAIEEMEINYVIDKTNVGTIFQLGLLYYNNKDLGKAQAAFEQAIKLSPNYSNARWYLAAVFEDQGKNKESIEQIEKVALLNPDNEMVTQRLQELKVGKVKPATTIPEPVEPEINVEAVTP
jgi:tetratricopeptide (TPR) repeat protein